MCFHSAQLDAHLADSLRLSSTRQANTLFRHPLRQVPAELPTEGYTFHHDR
ncbi:hypothetical protein [Streptomyces laurentii]|uniref:hypothetical protein n=1 Tax=Streptomyces laurentii TaxID=39478 RepID=UPI0033F53452